MRPQVGKGASLYKSLKEVQKTKARLFVESRKKHSITIKGDYLTMRDVAVAMNINAMEQRLITKRKILRLIEKGVNKAELIDLIENEIDLDRHRLTKYYGG
jgi:hypothetical protein